MNVRLSVEFDDSLHELNDICGLIEELRDMATDQQRAFEITDRISDKFGKIICDDN
jgi:hypothetical protein